ncbi:hypothetical protein ACQP2P_40445 [Dactylosporangium sp. CA-139114]|uniref:hypothetical protein n=1 Tax=Dactylosporangium sp. CA-139114 TaxID=3239931 RepID=UPI003D9548DA
MRDGVQGGSALPRPVSPPWCCSAAICGHLWRLCALSLLTGLVTAADGPALGRFGGMVAGPALLGEALANGSLISSTGRDYQVTMAAMSFGPLSGGPAGYGVLPTVFAAGTVLGALAVGRFREPRHPLLIRAGLVAGVLACAAGAASPLGRRPSEAPALTR